MVYICFSLTGAQVPITSYTCTQPSYNTFTDGDQCTVSKGLRTCAIKEGARPALLSSSRSLGLYGSLLKHYYSTVKFINLPLSSACVAT